MLTWPLTSDGMYSVKSAYNMIRHFMWRVSGESLPTKFNFHVRHVLNDNLCNLCDEHQKDAIHCLWLCDKTYLAFRFHVQFFKNKKF